ncbi:LmbE family N-acetylglucosaminyl deacetylase [Gillisia sp. Hel_I_86]|uniref:PIG-L deacetylase family protein n=1 Tax=Gillisia sp. Hel_I_86 TaxID=1249981 RepID=UPI00119973D8|nr:PIG-L deacetylase family protein [Gillisia sp. Hel_I_86]TVZ27178.1 LmbE family N-acetylglucosaminyl deacetylase [Gillisia sp. Hel_I_86]
MKNNFLFFLVCILSLSISMDITAQGEKSKLNIIVIGAHPDDADNKFGGTAALFAEMGHNVKFVSVTNGDAGHYNKGGGHLAKIRRAEAEEAAKILGVKEYTVLDNHDGELLPTLDVRHQIIREIRNWNADVVLSPRPADYHPDHRYTGILVQDAAYLVIVPNVTPDTPPLEKNPVFLYLEDRFQKPYPFQPDIVVDITSTFDKKIEALSAHESQMFEWLPWTSNGLEKVPAGNDERQKFMSANWSGSITSDEREALKKWYGDKKGENINYAESFEICEYGKQPSKEEILQLFPMLK